MMMTSTRAVCTALLFAAIALARPAYATSDPDAAAFAFVEELGRDAMKELADRAIPPSEREARFRRLLVDRFDMPAISKFVLGRYWRSANETQRAEFQGLFVDFIVGSYAARFSDYLGEGVKVTGSGAGDGGTILVHSMIDLPSAEDIRVDWRLRGADDAFVIVDLIVEGVSLEVTQRSQFASVIQSRGGIDGLMEALRTKSLQTADSTAPQ
jgi:phospholipid transport system substrate-binding protein